jgi:hypothetical protein
MKKPVLSIDEREPKEALRADRPPTEGFTVVVDGHFKSEFKTLDAAEASGRKLKSTYPMLKIEIYDAAKMVRTLLSWKLRLLSETVIIESSSLDVDSGDGKDLDDCKAKFLIAWTRIRAGLTNEDIAKAYRMPQS